MIVRIVTFEGLQPMVTEASTFMREIDQCRLEIEDSNANWKTTKFMIIIIGFATMTFAVWRLRRYMEHRTEIQGGFICAKVSDCEIKNQL